MRMVLVVVEKVGLVICWRGVRWLDDEYDV